MKEYKFTDEEIKLIGDALGKEPFYLVAAIIQKIQAQYNEQNKQSE